jgi:hypothetical protein
MKHIMNTRASADSQSGRYRGEQRSQFSNLPAELKRFLNWLGGTDTLTFSVAEKVVSRNLPPGIEIQQATAEELGRATKAAIKSHNELSGEIIKFAFSSLKAHDGEKCEAVIRSVISVISAQTIPDFIRIAVRARPSLASTVANTTLMLVPEKAEQISRAVASVVCC